MADAYRPTAGSVTAWDASGRVLANNQLGIVRYVDGTPELIIGDGVHPRSTLPALASDPNAVRATAQTLTATQQVQARSNVGAASVDAVGFAVDRYYPSPTPTAAQQHAALAAACSAASAVGGAVILPPGTTNVVGSFPMSGYRCSIVGHGTASVPGGSGSAPMGSVIECVSQTGPVLNFTGYVPPKNQAGRVRFANFTVKGDGTADSSSDTAGSVTVGGGAKKGIYIPSLAVYAATFSNLLITNCGGIHLDAADLYLSDFYAVTVTDPISAATNNVPYVRMRACNGVRVIGMGLRSVQATGPANVGTAGAMRLEASAVGYWDRAQFSGCWVENCWVPSGGSVIVTQTSGVAHRDWQFYDVFKVTGATGTSRMRLEPSTTGGTVAGNIVDGYIHGGAGGTNDIDYGIDVTQSRNRIQGIKGFPGNNVRLAATIAETLVFLGGAEGSGTTTTAVVDNSGRNDNTIIDTVVGWWQLASASGFTTRETLSGQHVRNNRVTTTISSAISAVPDLSTGNTLFVYTLNSAGISIGAPTGTTDQLERTLNIILKQDATGSRTVTWSGSYAWKSGSAPTLKTAASAVDTFQFIYDGSVWQQV